MRRVRQNRSILLTLACLYLNHKFLTHQQEFVRKVNWRRGLVRLWLVLAVSWITAAGAWTAQQASTEYEQFESHRLLQAWEAEFRRLHGISHFEWCVRTAADRTRSAVEECGARSGGIFARQDCLFATCSRPLLRLPPEGWERLRLSAESILAYLAEHWNDLAFRIGVLVLLPPMASLVFAAGVILPIGFPMDSGLPDSLMLIRPEAMNFKSLNYEYYMQYYRNLFSSSSDETMEYAQQEAQHLHSLAVCDALRDLFIEMVNLSYRLRRANAGFYMRYGAGRRLNMMWWAYREIIFTAPPGRMRPLNHQEQQILSREINLIYMNLRGVLDNFAWCVLHEIDHGIAKSLKPKSVNLFCNRILLGDPFVALRDGLVRHRDWYHDVANRRDPVAHRIPLYVPQANFTPEDAIHYAELEREFFSSARELDCESAMSRLEKMHEVGKFHPSFVHHPDEPLVPVYPTVPDDIAHLVEIGRAIDGFLRNSG